MVIGAKVAIFLFLIATCFGKIPTVSSSGHIGLNQVNGGTVESVQSSIIKEEDTLDPATTVEPQDNVNAHTELINSGNQKNETIEINQVNDATEQSITNEEDIFDATNSTLDLATTIKTQDDEFSQTELIDSENQTEPSFMLEWVDSLTIQVTWPNNNTDVLKLTPLPRSTDCRFTAEFESDLNGSAFVIGCNDSISTIVDMSSSESGFHELILFANGTTVEISTYLDENIYDTVSTDDSRREVQVNSSIRHQWILDNSLMKITWPNDHFDLLSLTSSGNPEDKCTYNARLHHDQDRRPGKVLHCEGSNVTIVQMESSEFGNQELILWENGTTFEQKIRNPTAWNGQCMKCHSQDGCAEDEIGTVTQCVDGTVACIYGTMENGRKRKHCGPVDELPPILVMNACVSTSKGEFCACDDSDNCNKDPEITIEDRVRNNTEAVEDLSQKCASNSDLNQLRLSNTDLVNQVKNLEKYIDDQVEKASAEILETKRILNIMVRDKVETLVEQKLETLKEQILDLQEQFKELENSEERTDNVPISDIVRMTNDEELDS